MNKRNRIPLVGMLESGSAVLREGYSSPETYEPNDRHRYKIEPMHVGYKTQKTVYSVVHYQAGSNHGWEIGKFKTLEGAKKVAQLHAEHSHHYDDTQ